MFFVFLSSDLTQEKLQTFLKKIPQESLHQKNVIIAWDKQGKITREIFQTYQLPETVLINEKGELYHKIVGVAQWDSEEILNLLNGRSPML